MPLLYSMANSTRSTFVFERQCNACAKGDHFAVFDFHVHLPDFGDAANHVANRPPFRPRAARPPPTTCRSHRRRRRRDRRSRPIASWPWSDPFEVVQTPPRANVILTAAGCALQAPGTKISLARVLAEAETQLTRP